MDGAGSRSTHGAGVQPRKFGHPTLPSPTRADPGAVRAGARFPGSPTISWTGWLRLPAVATPTHHGIGLQPREPSLTTYAWGRSRSLAVLVLAPGTALARNGGPLFSICGPGAATGPGRTSSPTTSTPAVCRCLVLRPTSNPGVGTEPARTGPARWSPWTTTAARTSWGPGPRPPELLRRPRPLAEAPFAGARA